MPSQRHPGPSAAPSLGPGTFLRVLEQNAFLPATPGEDVGKEDALRQIAAETSASLRRGESSRTLLAELPNRIAASMERFGWSWNGFYALDAGGILRLGPAHGPPVCSELTPSGPLERGLPLPFSSGMCFDGLLLNQTLVASPCGPGGGNAARAAAAGPWPGYVSCDAKSGLETVAGIVSPLRDPSGRPIGVWDLDASRAAGPLEVRFVDVFFATLSRCLALGSEDLLPR